MVLGRSSCFPCLRAADLSSYFLSCKQEDGRIENCAAFVGDGAAGLRPFHLSKIGGAGLTAVGGDEPVFPSAPVENLLRASGVEGRAAWAAMFRREPPAKGAHLYYRYESRRLTDQPLWPWPMNDRIKALTGLDVTATVLGLGQP